MKNLLLFILVPALLCGFLRAEITGPNRISPYAAPGSIYPDVADGRMHSLFADPTAFQVGDFVTIVVNLSTVTALNKNLTTAKTASVNDSLTSIVIPNNVAGNYASQWAAAQAFNGGGKQNDTEAFTTTIQARIVEVYPNGTFRVEAHRALQTGKEKSSMVLTGFVRQKDLAADNTVSSTQVADLQVRQDGVGDLSRSERKGWLTTIYEFLNPF